MDVLIYGLGKLLTLAVIAAASVAPVWLAYWVGNRTPWPALRWALPCLTLGLPLAWAMASYSTFTNRCASVAKAQFIISPPAPVEGFLLQSRNINSTNLIEQGAFKFIESPIARQFRRDYAGLKQDERAPVPLKTELVPQASLKSQYEVIELEPQATGLWFRPPIELHRFEVKERASGKLMARATELVLGGGLLGLYMALLGQDQDFEHLGCGYISGEAGPWRPTLASRPRFKQYLEADLRFLVAALGPARGQSMATGK